MSQEDPTSKTKQTEVSQNVTQSDVTNYDVITQSDITNYHVITTKTDDTLSPLPLTTSCRNETGDACNTLSPESGGNDEYNIHIATSRNSKNVELTDRGWYECQFYGGNVISTKVYLEVLKQETTTLAPSSTSNTTRMTKTRISMMTKPPKLHI